MFGNQQYNYIIIDLAAQGRNTCIAKSLMGHMYIYIYIAIVFCFTQDSDGTYKDTIKGLYIVPMQGVINFQTGF